ncbi:MAG: mechanosensitive ion channel family protein [Armatimonadota bacterium]
MRLRERCTHLIALAAIAAGLVPAALWAQEEGGGEQPPPPPPDLGEQAGLWWAKLQDPEFQAKVLAGLISAVTVIVITAIIYTVVILLFRRAIARVERDTEEAVQPDRRRKQRVVTVLELLRSVASWVILITGFVWVLASVGMDIRPVLAGAGVLGLAVGFGAQNLVRDIVSGFFMLLEGQYAVGDYIQVGGNFGMVESIGMRVTVLKDLDNQRHFLPNGSITQVTVYEEPFVNYVVEVPLASADDCERAVQELAKMARALKTEYERYLVHYDEPTSVIADGGAVVRLPVAVFPTQEWLVNEEIPTSINDTLAGAEIPLREGRSPRVYMDLTRMPQYRYREEKGEGEVV